MPRRGTAALQFGTQLLPSCGGALQRPSLPQTTQKVGVTVPAALTRRPSVHTELGKFARQAAPWSQKP